MLHEVSVDFVLVKEDAPGTYSVLLHDPDGQGWRLPGGDVLDVADEDELPEPNSVYQVSCFHHLKDQTNLSPEVIEDFDILPYQWIRSTHPDAEVPHLSLVYWALVEADEMELVEEQLKDKNGNARFFSYMKDNGECALPELCFMEHEQAIVDVMNRFYKKVN